MLTKPAHMISKYLGEYTIRINGNDNKINEENNLD